MSDIIDRAKSRAYDNGVFSHGKGGGAHVGTHKDGQLGTFHGVYTRDDNGAVREWMRTLPNGNTGIHTDQPEYPLDVDGIVRIRAYLMTDMPAGKLGCIAAGIDHRHGPGTGCLMFHNGAEWEEIGQMVALPALAPISMESTIEHAPGLDAILSRLSQLEAAYTDLRHAFENHGHRHDTLLDAAE